jgi:hypothetical protein
MRNDAQTARDRPYQAFLFVCFTNKQKITGDMQPVSREKKL